MTTKKPDPDFVIRLVAPGLRPWVVPMGALARVLQSVQRLLDLSRGLEIEEEEDGYAAEVLEPTSLHLIAVKSGSAAYPVATEDSGVLGVLEGTGRVICDPGNTEWNPAILSPIERLSQIARKLQCQIEFRRPTKTGEVLATIGPETFSEIASVAFVKGETSVIARIERVGGATKKGCGLRLEDQHRMVHCDVETEDLVRQLGRYVWEYVFVTGVATWYRRNWSIRHILIKGFDDIKTGPVITALDRIHKAGGSAWDDVDDPDAEIMEMRG